MKLLQALGLVGIALSTGAFAADCDSVAESIKKKIEAAPEKVLMIVEDAMATHDKCACEIVKAAIVASKANEKLVGEIVFTAVIASESMAPTVAECAISVAPDSASQIRSALKRALSDGGDEAYTESSGGKAPLGKNPSGKEYIPSAKPVDDYGFRFGRSPLDVRGIYLLAPSPGGVVTQDVVKIVERIKKVPGDTVVVRIPISPSNSGPEKKE